MAVACTAIGLFVALFPDLWISDNPQIVRLGTWYLRIVGPIHDKRFSDDERSAIASGNCLQLLGIAT